MRGLICGGLLMLLALTGRAEDPAALDVAASGSFAPRGANFRVAFQFSDLKAVPNSTKKLPRMLPAPALLSPAREWSSAQGALARLELCCVDCPIGLSHGTLAVARLRLMNPSDRPFHTTLAVAVAPDGAIHALAFDRHAFLMERKPVLISDTPSRGAILAESPFAPRPLTPQDQAHVESAKGECRGEMLFDLALMPGQTQALGFICPVQLPNGTDPGLDFYRTLSVDDLFARAEKAAGAR